jgi:hypothetical protein
MSFAGLRQSSGGGRAVWAFDSPLKLVLRGCANVPIDCNNLLVFQLPSIAPIDTDGTFGTAKDWGKVGECGVRGPREDPTILNRHSQKLA